MCTESLWCTEVNTTFYIKYTSIKFLEKEKNPEGALTDIPRFGGAQGYENGKLSCLRAYLSPKACALTVPFLLLVTWKTHPSTPKSDVTYWGVPFRFPRWKQCILYKAAIQIQASSTAPERAALSLLACKLLLLDRNLLQNMECLVWSPLLSGH